MDSILGIVRPIVKDLKRCYQIWKIRLKERTYRGMTLQEKFSHVYSTNAWGGQDGSGEKFDSGPGSRPRFSESLARSIGRLVDSGNVRSIADIGCGDFRVGQMILNMLGPRHVSYVGYDVVPDLVARNARTFGSDNVTFECLNVVDECPPPADLILVREVFQHLRNSEIESALRQLQSKFSYLVVTETVYAGRGLSPNRERLGDGVHSRVILKSGVYLDKPPFNVDAMVFDEVIVGENRNIRSLLIKNDALEKAVRAWGSGAELAHHLGSGR